MIMNYEVHYRESFPEEHTDPWENIFCVTAINADGVTEKPILHLVCTNGCRNTPGNKQINKPHPKQENPSHQLHDTALQEKTEALPTGRNGPLWDSH